MTCLHLFRLLVCVALFVTATACNQLTEGMTVGDCSDGADNDRDGLFDCDDPNCAGAPVCEVEGDDGGDDDTGDDDDKGDDDTTAQDDDD